MTCRAYRNVGQANISRWRKKYAKETAVSLQMCKRIATIIGSGPDCRSWGATLVIDPDYRAVYLALIIIIIVCAVALSIDFIVER